MSSLHLVDPELVPALEMFPQFDFSVEILAPFREQFDIMVTSMPKPEDAFVTMQTRTIPGIKSPDVEVLIYRPINQTDTLPAVLHIHGGGYVIGKAIMSDATARMIAKEVNCVVVSVDYRLSPDTQHPGPVEDCYSALKWLHDNAVTLRIDPGRLAVAGESAGGGLAASLCLLTRDRGEVKIAFQHLIYPMIDDRTAITQTPHPYTGEFGWTPKNNHFGWWALLGQEPGGEGISSYAAAARAKDLTGLPPTFIAVGALDLFLDEDIAYALRLTRAGVPTELHVYPGAYHGFQIAADTKIVAKATQDSLSAFSRALHPAA